jgi:hypothetical protein
LSSTPTHRPAEGQEIALIVVLAAESINTGDVQGAGAASALEVVKPAKQAAIRKAMSVDRCTSL